MLVAIGIAAGSAPLVGLAVLVFAAGGVARLGARTALDRVRYTRVVPETRAFVGEAIRMRLVSDATRRVRFAGAQTRSLALAAVRATREGQITEGGDKLDVIIGTPEPGETLDGASYDGTREIALFRGELPASPESVFEDGQPVGLRCLRFLPPHKLERDAGGNPILPHTRLDRAVDYLIGDWLK